MKVCFIDLPGWDKTVPNAGIAYMASSLMERGHYVKIIDLNLNTKDVEKRLSETHEYDIVGISIKSFAIRSALEVSKIVKNENLIWGGPHITVDGYNFLSRDEVLGIGGVVGEAEETIIEIAEAFENNKGLQDIRGVIYRDVDRIVVNPIREFVRDLDSLPYPNYEVFDSFNGTIEDYPLFTSRGCPHSCIFCCAGLLSGKKWRTREPSSVLHELEFAKSKYNSKRFLVLDDNFTLDMNRAKEICRLLIEHRLNMEFSCPNGIRADRLDDELAGLMKEAGCTSVGLGIESAVPEVFAAIKKSESLDVITSAISILKKHEIIVGGYFIIGLPGDNLERVKSGVKLAKKMGLSSTVWAHLSPYPKTGVWEWLSQNGRMLCDWEDAPHSPSHANIIFETDDFSQKERIDALNLANVRCRTWALLNPDESFVYNAFKMLKLVLKYDARNIFLHLFYALRNIGSIVRIYGHQRITKP